MAWRLSCEFFLSVCSNEDMVTGDSFRIPSETLVVCFKVSLFRKS